MASAVYGQCCDVPPEGDCLVGLGTVKGATLGSWHHYDGMWRVTDGRVVPLYVVFMPQRSDWRVAASTGEGQTPAKTGISITCEGLFLDAVPVPLGPGRRAFVYTRKREMRPVPLTDEEFRRLRHDSMKELGQSKLWNEKILPILKEEVWPEE